MGSQTSSPFLHCLLPVSVQDPHRDWQHLDSSDWLCPLCLAGDLYASMVRAANRRTFGLCGFLRWSHYMFRLIVHLSHGPLSFGICGQALFQVGLCRNFVPHPRIASSLALLQLLLPVSAQSDLSNCGFNFGSVCHRRIAVGSVCPTSISIAESRCVFIIILLRLPVEQLIHFLPIPYRSLYRVRLEWSHTGHPLRRHGRMG